MDSTGAGGTFRDDELIMAVIEAAKAWCNEAAEEMEWIKNNPNPNVRVNPFLLRIYLNTKALLEAEWEES